MSNAFSLGRLFGIQFRLHYTWFIIFILITISLSWELFPDSYPSWPLLLYWVMGIITSLLFFASVVAHELAHSLVGRANGITVKSITLFIFGGVAQMVGEITRPSAELKMAVAGPACSLVIGALSALIWFSTRSIIEPLSAMFQWLALVNLMLAVFNLVPGFPLDGGRVFRSILWRFSANYGRSTRIAARVGQGVGYVFILGGILAMFYLHDWLGGVWIVFIGWFLASAASTSYQQVRWSEALGGFTASQVMTPGCPVVPPATTVGQLVQEYVLASGHSCFLVADEGRLTGILTLPNIKAVAKQKWTTTPVREIIIPLDKMKIAYPGQDALSVLGQMEEYGINEMPVVSEGGVIGMITRDNLIRFLRIRSELKL